MGLVDTHCHLHFPDFRDDYDAMMSRAREAGLELFINVGTDIETSREALAIAKENDDVFATAGVHPHDAEKANAEVMTAIKSLLSDPKMVAVGEVGLDYFRNLSPKEVQQSVFRQFIQMHYSEKKPLVIHCRDAYEDMLRIFEEEKSVEGYSGVMHCFSSDRETMEKFLNLGFYISFAGPLTYKKNDALREACRHCPAERLLVETDAPYLSPQAFRGKRNEPAYVAETTRLAAELKGMDFEEMSQLLVANARKVFNLDH